VDAGLRALNAQDTGVFAARPLTTFADHANVAISGVPLQILTKNAITDPAVAWPGIEGFEAAFKALWGVS
jgi:energy-converting hydrogenase Eha subunit G